MFIYVSTYDSKILDIQLNDFIIKYPKMLTNNNILLDDVGYDSNKLLDKEKQLLKNRIKVEHVNAQLKKI
jgi:hypothetical protein